MFQTSAMFDDEIAHQIESATSLRTFFVFAIGFSDLGILTTVLKYILLGPHSTGDNLWKNETV